LEQLIATKISNQRTLQSADVSCGTGPLDDRLMSGLGLGCVKTPTFNLRVEKTILRILGSCTFLHSQGQKLTSRDDR
jgi:hypothetical protein